RSYSQPRQASAAILALARRGSSGVSERPSQRRRIRRDTSGLASEIRTRQEDGSHPARPRPLLVGALPRGLRVRDGHAGGRRGPAGRPRGRRGADVSRLRPAGAADRHAAHDRQEGQGREDPRSEEHTSELQSRGHLVCRLLLEKKKKKNKTLTKNNEKNHK